jgi:photosynthetic reaction center H subunit
MYLFVIFFFGLILYLRREDRREGYPLEEDTTGRLERIEAGIWFADPKVFRLPYGRGEKIVPNKDRDRPVTLAKRMAVWPGAPIDPIGDPLSAGVGPGAFADRRRAPDLTEHGVPRMAPLRIAKDFAIASNDPNPVGMEVFGVDGKLAGAVADVWVDRGEHLIRYLEIETTAALGSKRIIVPMPMLVVNRARGKVRVDAVTAAQLAAAPTVENADQITLYEEDRISAYFGAGSLYALPTRKEAQL